MVYKWLYTRKKIMSFATNRSIIYNYPILFQFLCEKNYSHILMVHLINKWWHANKKNDIIFSLQFFIHMASMIDDKVMLCLKYHMKMWLNKFCLFFNFIMQNHILSSVGDALSVTTQARPHVSCSITIFLQSTFGIALG